MRRQNDPRRDLPALLHTITRYAVSGFGIPSFTELHDFAPPEPFELITALLGDQRAADIRDIKDDLIDCVLADKQKQSADLLARLDEAFKEQQTHAAEAHYYVGIAVALRAINMARHLANVETATVIAELMTKRAEGGRR